MAPVFGVKVPVALVGILINISIGLLLLTTAMTRLPHHKVQRPVHIRGLLLGITLIGLFLFLGNVISLGYPYGGSGAKELASSGFIIIMIYLMPFIPVFATGIIEKKPIFQSLFSFSNRHSIFDDRPTSGIWFLALWWLASCTVLGLCAWLGQLRAGSSLPGMGTAYSFDWLMFMQLSLGLLAAIVGLSAIGILSSVIVKNRQTAAAIVLLSIILAFTVFPIMMYQHESSLNYSWQTADGPIWQVAYLCPLTVLSKLSNDWQPGVNYPRLFLPDDMVGVGSILAWGIVTVIILSLASHLQMRQRGKPHE
jgi:hypothetical protein